MDTVVGYVAIGLMGGSLAYFVYCILNGRRVRSEMTQVGNDNTDAIRENTAVVREHTEVLRQYIALKASEAK